jgi:WD repeat-containing protein 35
VLAALEVEAFREATLGAAPGPAAPQKGANGGGGGGGGGGGARGSAGAGAAAAASAAAATLAGLISVEAAADESRAFEGAWRGAEAYHFWLLAHRQLYGGQVGPASMRAVPSVVIQRTR